MSDRNLTDVIDRISEVVPENHPLHAGLTQVRITHSFRAPELTPITWSKLSETLQYYLPFPPQTPWQETVGQIIRGEELL